MANIISISSNPMEGGTHIQLTTRLDRSGSRPTRQDCQTMRFMLPDSIQRGRQAVVELLESHRLARKPTCRFAVLAEVRSDHKLSGSLRSLSAPANCGTSREAASSPKTWNLGRRVSIARCASGPSARHVTSMNSEDDYDRGVLDPPIDFGKISNRDFVAVCSQCHMQSAIRTPGPHGELNYSTTGNFFIAQSDNSIW